MLLAWSAGLQVATRTDTLAPMSPLSCVGFLGAALGTWAMPDRARLKVAAGAFACVAGTVGLLDALLADGTWVNRTLLGADVRISALTAAALVLLGVAIALDGHGWPITRRLAIAAGALGGAATIGFLLGVPLFYGVSRSVQMSWSAALCAMLIAFGVVLAHPVGTLFDRTLSGRFARRMVPPVLGIPVLSGALATAAARAGWWAPSVAAWVMTLAAVAGLAFVVSKAVERLAEDDRRLTQLAIRDPLTGAYNRRHFLAEAERAASRARRYGESAAIAVVDLDRFKEINDRWGHQAGDEALVRVHRALRTRLRSSDVLGRIGGDEFAALILHVNPGQALHVADEMRDAVAQVGREMTAEGRRNRLGASIGMATLDGHEDVEDLVDLADRRMYDEKRLAHQVEGSAHH
ncbi:GGDEF domain-containing protein [Solirubrobacter sp. CPCC 204708]|uniref:GGDEF domain-containing protein n=1 Tax=Solirubrobacter deserti TaxID=2282478 RepID=A0ABT4RFR3_9ACTN|nr:GGDEF domain-containing protein [Solirubrobacter deserti]MBE2318107.1 GGDEF domain-containing protein [Solirubrobacter deserti]MDA0137385.1 GGDEF domain-containing protein [Solirubrobacter deserti]